MRQIAHLQQGIVNPVASPHRGRNGLGSQVGCSQDSEDYWSGSSRWRDRHGLHGFSVNEQGQVILLSKLRLTQRESSRKTLIRHSRTRILQDHSESKFHHWLFVCYGNDRKTGAACRTHCIHIKWCTNTVIKTITLPVVLYGCETSSLTLRKERRSRVFEYRALRHIFGAKRDEVTGELRRLHNEELHDLYPSPNIMLVGMRHVWETGEVHREFWSGDLSERDHLEDLGADGIVLIWIIKKLDGEAWTGLIWLRIGTGGRRL